MKKYKEELGISDDKQQDQKFDIVSAIISGMVFIIAITTIWGKQKIKTVSIRYPKGIIFNEVGMTENPDRKSYSILLMIDNDAELTRRFFPMTLVMVSY